MKLVSVKCPECRAAVKLEEGAARVTCDYCGKTSLVQRRTRILEVPIRPQWSPKDIRTMPVATQIHSARWRVFAIALPVAMMVVIGAIGFTVSRKVRSQQAAIDDRYGWWSSGIILADVNGDAAPDPVGKIFYATRDAVHIAAFDGATGERLWMTPKIGDSSDSQMFLTHSGDTVVLANSIGKLSGYAVATGEPGWEASLPEAPRRPCRADSSDAVVIVTADDVHRRVALADGTVTAAPKPKDDAPCLPVATDARDTAGPDAERADTDAWDPRKPSAVGGVYVSYHLFPVAGDVTYAFGTRKQGTSIPMLAAFRTTLPDDPDGKASYEVIWEMQVPAREPLAAYASAPIRAALDDQAVYVVYDMKKGPHRLASFRRADGARRWDVPLPDEDLDWIFALRSTGDLVYLSDSLRLVAFSAADGSHVRTVADGTW